MKTAAPRVMITRIWVLRSGMEPLLFSATRRWRSKLRRYKNHINGCPVPRGGTGRYESQRRPAKAGRYRVNGNVKNDYHRAGGTPALQNQRLGHELQKFSCGYFAPDLRESSF
jgi:hypothetical protein